MTKRKVLIPLDGSDFSKQILPYVIKFLSPQMVELVLMHAAQHPSGLTGKPTRPASAEVPVPMYETARDVEYTMHPVYASQELESRLARFLDELNTDAARLREAGYTVYTAVKFGDPKQEIVDFILDEDIDMVAMTTHGRSGLSRLIAGSVAEYVMRHAAVPVMMLRPIEVSADLMREAEVEGVTR